MKRSYFWLAIGSVACLASLAAVALVLNFDVADNRSVPVGKKFVLPELPYAYDALEPYIDKETMKIHHSKHHQAYVGNLNAVLKDHPELSGLSLEYLLTHLEQVPQDIRTVVADNAGGHYNHSFFWQILGPAKFSRLGGSIKQEINKAFGSFEKFKQEFGLTAKKVFGSGWAWLCFDPANKKLVITSTKDQDSPISIGLVPVLGLDVWEHAYYLKYQNRRIDYINSWWHVINWERVQVNYDNAIKAR